MQKIKNFGELAVTETRQVALDIAEAGFQAIDTEKILHSIVKCNGGNLSIQNEEFPLEKIKRILVVAIGKCAMETAAALEDILGNRISNGVAVDIKMKSGLKRIKAFQGTHPLPTEANVNATKAVVEILANLNEDDLVLFAISGGGSTLLCLSENTGYKKEAIVVESLMRAGATIQEINTVRKHLSLARGGYLAKYAYPAQVISLIFCDVPEDNLEFVASGPTFKDRTTIEEAQAILAKYDILKTSGIERRDLVETPKEEKYFKNVRNILVVSNAIALEAMKAKAQELGFAPRVRAACLKNDAQSMGLTIARELHSAGPKTAFLCGGETTVVVRDHGRGGRNLELALSAIPEIKDDEIIVTIASDGLDNGPFAGAICDKITKRAIDEGGFDLDTVLKENNTYPLFEKIGNYLLTGNTGSNVSDLLIALKQ